MSRQETTDRGQDTAITIRLPVQIASIYSARARIQFVGSRGEGHGWPQHSHQLPSPVQSSPHAAPQMSTPHWVVLAGQSITANEGLQSPLNRASTRMNHCKSVLSTFTRTETAIMGRHSGLLAGAHGHHEVVTLDLTICTCASKRTQRAKARVPQQIQSLLCYFIRPYS